MQRNTFYAYAILIANEMHVKSFCRACFNEAQKAGEVKARIDPANAESYKPNPEDFYHVDLESAIEFACDITGMVGFEATIEMLLKNSHKEILDWAKEEIEPKPDQAVQEIISALFGVVFR